VRGFQRQRDDPDGYHNPFCVNALPLALLMTVFYALPRYAFDCVRGRG
jgi:hypothetical protein